MELLKTSASQVKDFQACARLWFFKNVKRCRPPQTEAQSRGTAVHAALESFLKTGAVGDQPPAPGVTVEEFVEYVDKIKPFYAVPAGTKVSKSIVEHRDEMPTYEGGPTFVLVVDHAREVEIAGRVIPQIDDLKTLSDFRYCKTPDELARDAQMVSYARWALRQFELENEPLPEFVSIRHVYVRTRGKRISTARDRLMTPEEVFDRWGKILDEIRAMAKLAAEIEDPMEVFPNTDHCSAYGGCFFRPDCHGAPPKSIAEAFEKEQREANGKGDTDMTTNAKPSLLARLKAQQGQGGQKIEVVPVVQTELPHVASANGARLHSVPKPEPAAAPASGGSRLSRLRSTMPVPAAPVSETPPAAEVPSVVAPVVLPPDAPPRETPPVDVPPAASAEPAAVEPGKRRRRSRLTVDTSAIDGKAVPELPQDAPRPVVLPPAAPESDSIVPATVAVICKLEELYIDCMPVKGCSAHGLAEEILGRAGADAAAKENVHDWRMISYTARGVLAQAIRARLGELPPVLVVSSSLSGSDVLIETLAPIARKVVRALRG